MQTQTHAVARKRVSAGACLHSNVRDHGGGVATERTVGKLRASPIYLKHSAAAALPPGARLACGAWAMQDKLVQNQLASLHHADAPELSPCI